MRLPKAGTKVEDLKCLKCNKTMAESKSCSESDCPQKVEPKADNVN